MRKVVARRYKQKDPQQSQSQQPSSQSSRQPPANIYPDEANDPKKEEQYQQYASLQGSNPQGFTFSNRYLPCSASVASKVQQYLSLTFTPTCLDKPVTNRNAEKIPRCGSCSAYMNYYNERKEEVYRCFICQRENYYPENYNCSEDHIEFQQPSYQVFASPKSFEKSPPEESFMFLIDLNQSSFHCQMLSYAIMVIKQVLAQQQYDDYQIYFFTYDQTLHQYDFSGEEPRCIAIDPSIKETLPVADNYLSQIRDKLFGLLDQLPEVCEQNKKEGSYLCEAMAYVSRTISNFGGKIFIIQSNEDLAKEPMLDENKKTNINEPRKKLALDSYNKSLNENFFRLFCESRISFALFSFGRNFKNLKQFLDLGKRTCSQIFCYQKDSPNDLMKFYYQFHSVLNTPCYSYLEMDFSTCPGWTLNLLYGQYYKIKEANTIKLNHVSPSKSYVLAFNPPEYGARNPYFVIQINSNYMYGRQSYLSVSTVVAPLTSSIEKLFLHQNTQAQLATLWKTALATIRVQYPNTAASKLNNKCSNMLRAALAFHKMKKTDNMENLPLQIRQLMLGYLSFFKHSHFHLESIKDTPIFDQIAAQRNFMEYCGTGQMNNIFIPYLFDLSNMDATMCQEEDFTYPPSLQLKFQSIREGLFLLDNGFSLIIFLAQKYNPHHLQLLFGKQKLGKNDVVSEDMLNEQQNMMAVQVQTLIRVLRQQKFYGWAPVKIVRCGESTYNEKLFYMNFCADKYEEFRSCKHALTEFIEIMATSY